MEESNNKKPTWLEQIFSVKGLLIGVALLMGYWIFFDKSEEKADFSNMVGVGQAINSETAQKLNIDLSEYLDPQIVPAIVEESLKTVAQSGAQEQAFMQGFINEVSTRLQSVSTIDLNADGIPDPLLVIPKQVAEGAEHMTLSIRVPDFSEVKTLPEGTDQEAWKDIAENKSLEIMTASAVKSKNNELTVQAAANPQTYSSHPPYYSHHSSIGSMFMTAMMVNWMMTPRMYPYGGYGMPPQTSNIQRNQTSNYSKASGTNTPAQSASGKSIASNQFSKIKPTAMNQVRSSEFKKQSKSTVRSGAFGRSINKPQVQQSRRATPSRSSRRSFGRRRR